MLSVANKIIQMLILVYTGKYIIKTNRRGSESKRTKH
jgi:hypothetical protein